LDEGPENEGGENLLTGAQQCCWRDSADRNRVFPELLTGGADLAQE